MPQLQRGSQKNPLSTRRLTELFQISGRVLVIGVSVAAIISVSLFAVFVVSPILFPPPPDKFDRVPDFTLTAWNGTTFSLSDFDGKVVLLDFMRTSCYYCIQEIPELKEVRETYPTELVMITISVRDDTDASLAALAEVHEIDWLMAVDTPSQNVAGEYGIHYTPTHVILDQNRQLVRSLTGATTAEFLSSIIDPLLAEQSRS